MKSKLTGFIDDLIVYILLVVAAFTPILFLNKTTEFYETPKLIFLVISVIILLGLWIITWIIRGRIAITKTPLDLPLILLGFVILASTFFSTTQHLSIFGNLPRVHGSAASWIVYILLFFVAVSNLKRLRDIRLLIYALFTGTAIVCISSLLSFFNVYLPFDFARSATFTPTGSSFSTTSLALLLIPFLMSSLIHPNKYIPAPIAIALSVLLGITIIFTGSFFITIGFFVLLGTLFLVSKPNQIKKTFFVFIIPVLFFIAALAVAYIPFDGNLIYEKVKNFPQEVQLPLDHSWKIAASALRDSPIIGTGPATYLFNFTTYKPAEFNLTSFWNFSFDTSYNEILQVMTTLGFAGLIALIILSLAILNNSRKGLSLPGEENHNFLLPAAAISGMTAIVLFFLHVTTLVSLSASFLVLAILMASQKSIREHILEFSFGKSRSEAMQIGYLPLGVFLAYLAAAAFVIYQVFNATAADYYHREALARAGQNGSETYSFLQKAETLSPNIDLYRIDLAQTNFALANAIAAQKGPSASTPQGSLTDQDKKTIQTLLSQAISEGKAATALNPRSARNWEVLGSIYRNISGVAENSSAFALDAYGRAIQLDPMNPSLRLAVGGIYYSAKNYDLAIRFFSDAINLKNDYANAYYNLAIALRDKGDIQNAGVVAERMMTLLRSDSQDYKTGSVLLEELKKRAAGETSTSQNQKTQNSGALNNTDLNIDLDNPPTTATPAAVRNSNSSAPITPTQNP